jgi:hypothetical protein
MPYIKTKRGFPNLRFLSEGKNQIRPFEILPFGYFGYGEDLLRS